MIGQVKNSLFSLQTVIEGGVKVKSIHSYYLSSHENRILYCIMKLKVSMKLKQNLYVTATGILKASLLAQASYPDTKLI